MDKEKEKEVVLFVMSMSPSMGTLAPAPIDMDEMDEFQNKEEAEYKSRWSHCSDVIRVMVQQLAGCNVAIRLAKNTDFSLSTTRGNSDDQIDPILSMLDSIAVTCKWGDAANPEFVLREIESMQKSTEFAAKFVHWFIDVDTFLTIKPQDIGFAIGNVSIYVVGELRAFRAEMKMAKEAGVVWTEKLGVDLKLLACGADFEDLKRAVSEETRYEWRTEIVECFVNHDTIRLELLSQSILSSPRWSVSAISVLGFVPEIELCRLNILGEPCNVSQSFHVSAAADDSDNDILYSLAWFMLSSQKYPMTCICQCLNDEAEVVECCLLVAHSDEENKVGLMLLRFENLTTTLLEQFELQLLDHPTEQPEPLPDDTYLKFAPIDKKEIKRRLAKIEKLEEDEKLAKYEEILREYRLLNSDEYFMAVTEQWRIDQGFAEGPPTKENNNNPEVENKESESQNSEQMID